MTYEPTVWEDGQVITAEKLNKLEQGVQNEQIGPSEKMVLQLQLQSEV